MRKISSTLLWGAVLIVVGILALLSTLDLLGNSLQFVWSLLFAAAGIGFVSAFVRNRERWWALIPGLSAIGLALMVGLGGLLPDKLQAILSLAPLALAFVLIYCFERAQWWALIPAGTLLSVCLVVVFSRQDVFDEGSLMMFGLGATFAAVAALGTPKSQVRWAWIPAGVLAVLGAAILLGSVGVARYVWPISIILVGVFLLHRATLENRTVDTSDDQPPQPPTEP